MTRALLLLAALSAILSPAFAQPVTGLSGWSIYLDPGHSQRENVGVYGYSEAEKTLRVGLALREMLLTQTDIDTVYISRTNDQQQVSLAQRVDHANTVAASHFHSIHSNAGAPSANTIFVLWPQYRSGEEARPTGGRRMSVFMADLLGRGMRIPSQGAIGECDFYGAADCSTVRPKGSRNYVQGNTLMASELSEAGFHTSPVQNQRNMNAEWKRLEAQAMYWSILDYHEVPRPVQHVATGIVSDLETGLPINGATVTVGDSTYTTDTYESLFQRFSTDPDQLRNGFYYLEGLEGGTLPVTVDAEGYAPFSGDLVLSDTFFTFLDVQLVSEIPPAVASSSPAQGAEAFRVTDPIVINFTRRMDRVSVLSAFSLSPETTGSFAWSNDDRRLTFRPDSLRPQTDYTLTIASTATGAFGDPFDGNGDGTAGDAYVVTFRTGFPDTAPPRVVASEPMPNTTGVHLEPVITFAFDEPVASATLEGRVQLERIVDEATIPGRFEHYVVSGQSIVSYFPDEELAPNEWHSLIVAPGVEDAFGNVSSTQRQIRFRTGSIRYEATSIEDFDQDFTSDWWAPQQSGTTTGVVTDSTGRSLNRDVVLDTTAAAGSMELRYGWDAAAGTWLIREYLGGGAARSVLFDDSYLLQAYVFGDGSGVQFRFAVDDRVPAEGAGNHEVSPWYSVDWKGWRLVSWDLQQDGAGAWLGDGSLDGSLRFDSFQLTHLPGDTLYGALYIDDLRIARRLDVSVGAEDGDQELSDFLDQNYPNPFSASTRIRFGVAQAGHVTLTVYDLLGREVATLHDGHLNPGVHTAQVEGHELGSGTYVYVLRSGTGEQSRKMIFVR